MEYFHFVGNLFYELMEKKIQTGRFRVQLGIVHSPSKKNLGHLAILEDDEGGKILGTISSNAKDAAKFVQTQEYSSLLDYYKFVQGCANANGEFASLCKNV